MTTCDLDTYRVRPDDSLWAISRKLVGPAASLADVDALTDKIFEINLSTIGHNPDLIHPGQSLSLPRDCSK